MARLVRTTLTLFAGVALATVAFAADPLAPPANDECAGAITIPDGPYPLVMPPVDITSATPQGSDDPDACPGNGVDQDVWWSFTPSDSGGYVFSTCAGGGDAPPADGSTVYDTVLGVLDGCPAAGAATLVCNDTAARCLAYVPFAPYVDQSTGAATLVAGHTYYIFAGHWSGDVGGVTAGFNQIALAVSKADGPQNDTCSAPAPLALDRITQGTTMQATNDYRSPAGCFQGFGQIPSSANGIDVVFSFTPPDADTYSFRYVQDDSGAALRSQSPVLYLADNCPAPNNAAPITGCIAAANRMDDQTTGNGNRSEEISCVPLAGGTPYYLFFDDRFTDNAGGPLAVEVTRCRKETEPNDGIATATPYVPNAGCFMEGTSAPSGPAGDVDFYDLGAPPAGSKIFAALDAAASNQSDYTMRLTTATDTIGYDDNDGTSWVGGNAPIIAGPIAPGGEIYARVNSVPAVAGNEPYSLFARIETGAAQSEAIPDDHSVDGSLTFFKGTTKVTGGGFVTGTMASVNDSDCFEFVAHEGDNIVAFADNNPSRAAGTVTNVWPVLATLDHAPPSNTAFQGQVVRNLISASPGTLTGVTPSVVSEFEHFRARYTGAYLICYAPVTDVNSTTNPPASAYPLPYQGSISLNCGPIPGPALADLSIAMTGPVGTAMTGLIVDYTITLTNHDATGVAQDVRFVDQLPPEVVFVGLAVIDGFGGNNTGCTTLPTLGANDAPVDCTNFSIAPGASVTYTLSVQVGNCIGAGHTVLSSASITTYTPDGNPANDSASWTFTTTEDGSCDVLLCGETTCFHNACLVGDLCEAGVCQATPRGDCDDHNVCTDDSCDPTNADHPCINDSSQLGDCCGDGNDCTFDTCDPIAYCVFPPKPAGTTCDDFQHCTSNDACNGAGECVGHSACDDGLPCTDDFADEANNCACDNPLSFPGTVCDDANACTSDTFCDGLGGAAANCNGGTSIGAADVSNVHVEKIGGAAQISWSATVNATAYDVVRGAISSLPVGPGGGDENCLSPNVAGTTAGDPTNPLAGQGFFYLIRGKADCGSGPYGTQGLHGAPSTPRATTTCGS
jgi:uncharacterized repeat protein (TIGR01451 family)